MMEKQDPVEAFYSAAGLRLINKTVAAARIFSEYVKDGELRPFILMTNQAGTERNNWLYVRDPAFVFVFRCVADVAADARRGREQALELLNRAGINQNLESPMDGGANWYISSTNVEGLLQMPPYMINNTRRFDYGFNLYVKMFQKG
jgi:hypothetical protein